MRASSCRRPVTGSARLAPTRFGRQHRDQPRQWPPRHLRASQDLPTCVTLQQIGSAVQRRCWDSWTRQEQARAHSNWFAALDPRSTATIGRSHAKCPCQPIEPRIS